MTRMMADMTSFADGISMALSRVVHINFSCYLPFSLWQTVNRVLTYQVGHQWWYVERWDDTVDKIILIFVSLTSGWWMALNTLMLNVVYVDIRLQNIIQNKTACPYEIMLKHDSLTTPANCNLSYFHSIKYDMIVSCRLSISKNNIGLAFT